MTTVARQVFDDGISRATHEGLHNSTEDIHDTGEMAALVWNTEEQDTTDAVCQTLMTCVQGYMEELALPKGESVKALINQNFSISIPL